MLKLTRKIAVFGLATCVAAPAILAQAAPPRAEAAPRDEREVNIQAGEQGVEVQVRKDEQAATRKVQQGKEYGAYRASDLLEMSVMNAEGKDLGSIEDIVVSTNDGQVRYAAMSFGGFLGIGDKMFAIPWDALRMKKTDDSTFFVLNVTKEKLENAPGFDQDNWPNFADTAMTAKLDEYYRTDDSATRRADRPAIRNRPNADQPAAANPAEPSTSSNVYRVSQVNDFPVNNAQGENIADIEDVVIDIDEGKIRYVAVSFDDSWGYGEKLFALPWKALKFQHQDDQTTVVLNVTQAQMKTATGFDGDDWPNFADQEWRDKTDKFYLNTPGAKVEIE